jgi:DNA-binding LacI/PurR family transcriptional regulator
LRLQGYQEALREAGLPLDPEWLASVPAFHRADGAQAMRTLMALPTPPDAVFCFNDLLALGALCALYDAGRRIPEDVAVVGFDNIEEGMYAMPSLTTIAPDKQAIAHVAVNVLIDRIQGKRTGSPERVVVPHALLTRESTLGMPTAHKKGGETR